MAVAADEDLPNRRVTLPALFTGFLVVSLCGFGGPIVWARRILVERRRWLGNQEFAEILSFCQFLPGPNVVSVAVCLGARFRGPVGALVALAGFILIPWTVGFALGTLFLNYAQLAIVQSILHGISAAAAGLIIATGIRLLMAYRERPPALLVAALAFAALALAKLPLLLVVSVLLPVGIAVAGRDRAAPA